jgi:hypothetical protein
MMTIGIMAFLPTVWSFVGDNVVGCGPQLARASGKNTIKTLDAIMCDVKASPAARIAAAVALLDRGYGRPEQSFTGALNVAYTISDQPMSAEEWARQYATPSPESQH